MDKLGVCINRYTLLYIKRIHHQVLLRSTGNYIQYFIITYKGKESGKYIYIREYLTESLCGSSESDTTL